MRRATLCTSAVGDAIIPRGQRPLISDPLRTEPARIHDAESAAGRDAKIEQLLLVGLDHYFAADYELAINVWTRALFIDRSHARARAYIERARSALAERQRESEELLQKGVAAFSRGEGDEARRLLQAAIDGGAPSEEALTLLDRMNRFEAAPPPVAIVRADRRTREEAAPAERHPSRSMAGLIAFLLLGAAIVGLATFAASRDRIEWRAFVALVESAGRVAAPAPPPAAPVIREAPLPLPRRGETILARARALAASGHLRDALALAESIRATDPQKFEADRLRADIQRQLLALTEVPILAAPGEQASRRVP
jgi:tetratricopeptide (TPR) repeat protein